MDRWLVMARGWLFSNGNDNGDVVTLSFEKGGESLAELLKDAYGQGRKDADTDSHWRGVGL
jgi:hypothetical protein